MFPNIHAKILCWYTVFHIRLFQQPVEVQGSQLKACNSMAHTGIQTMYHKFLSLFEDADDLDTEPYAP